MNKFFYLLLTLFFSIGLSAQAGDALTGLTKAKPGELGERLMRHFWNACPKGSTLVAKTGSFTPFAIMDLFLNIPFLVRRAKP
jgi:hypothetical protein